MPPSPTEISFFQIQTQTAWGRTLAGFAAWALSACNPRLTPASRILDVGCGPGLLPALLARDGPRVVGCDVDLEALHNRLHWPLVQADVLFLPFATACFDLVTASNILFLLREPAVAFHEIARVLRPGGVAALLNPSEQMSISAAAALADRRGLTGLDRQSLINWATRAEAHSRWNAEITKSLLTSAGLEMKASILKIEPGLARWSIGVKL